MTYFKTHILTPEERQFLLEFSRRPWTAEFCSTVDSKTLPGTKVDMYILLDDDSGDRMVSIAVPHGHGYLANWIASCCGRPWFVDQKLDGKASTEMSIAFNKALKPFIDENGQLDGRDVAVAAISILTAYIEDLPKHARDELSNRLLVGINEMMRMD